MEGDKCERVAQHSQPFGFFLNSLLSALDFGKQTVNFKPHSRIGDSVPRSLFNLDPKFGLAQHTHWVGAASRR